MSEFNQEPLIAAREIHRVYPIKNQDVVGLEPVSIDISPGDFIAITGRSGSGKTTLLNILSGLDQPTNGTVLFQGQDLSGFSRSDLTELRRHKVGFVFQSFGLLPLLSAFENVELPLHIGGSPLQERRARATHALEQVGLASRIHHRPYELSGGEQQRVAIARAMATDPQIIFADEPTAELDSTTALFIIELLKDLAISRTVAIVVATHDPQLYRIAPRTIHLVNNATTPNQN